MKARPDLVHRGRTLRDEIRTSATPQQAWAAWTDAAKIAQWFVDRAEGAPEVGSTFVWEFERFGYKFPYQVIAAEAPHHFALLAAPPGREPGILEINIAREGGETVIRLVNSGFAEGAEWDEEYQGVVSGWKMCLGVLKHYLERHFGEERAQFLAMRPAQFSYEQLAPYYRDARLLAEWLGTSGGIGEVGDAVALKLHDGESLTGRVLARTGWEVAVSWEEVNGTLELKGFSMGPGKRTLGLRGFGWGMDPERAKAVEPRLAAALDRLAARLGSTK